MCLNKVKAQEPRANADSVECFDCTNGLFTLDSLLIFDSKARTAAISFLECCKASVLASSYCFALVTALHYDHYLGREQNGPELRLLIRLAKTIR